MKTTLDTREARADLTSRECAKMIGGTVGCLLGMASPEEVKTALRWWGENADKAVSSLAALVTRSAH